MKSKIARVSGLQSSTGAIMLRACQTTSGLRVPDNTLAIRAETRIRHVGVAASGIDYGGWADNHRHIERMCETNDPAARPVPQKLITRNGVGPHGPVDPGGDPAAQTVGPRSRVQSATPLMAPASEWRVPRPAARVAGEWRGADTSRPSAPVMRRAVALQTCVLRDRRDIPTPSEIAIRSC